MNENKIHLPKLAVPVTVVGGGIMGALASLTAAQLGYSVVWFGPNEQGRTDGADARNYALAPLTVDLLKRVGVWKAIESFVCQVTRMEVFSGETRVDLAAADAGSEFLSAMVLHKDLLNALEQAAQFRPQIQRVLARPDCIEARTEGVQVLCEGQSMITQLLVGADGARSWVRQQAGINWGQRDYGQQGVVATFHAEHPHGGVAAQWFDRGEILALLPLADPHKLSMVWSTSKSNAASQASMSQFGEELTDRTKQRFGKLTLEGGAVAAPLRMLLTDSQSSLRTVLLGDAAHTVHPLAGYGLNLGVQDLLCLEALWQSSREDPGAYSLLRAYDRSRRLRVKKVQWALDLLQRFVTQTNPTFERVRALGMGLVGSVGPLRQFLIRQAISPQ